MHAYPTLSPIAEPIDGKGYPAPTTTKLGKKFHGWVIVTPAWSSVLSLYCPPGRNKKRGEKKRRRSVGVATLERGRTCCRGPPWYNHQDYQVPLNPGVASAIGQFNAKGAALSRTVYSTGQHVGTEYIIGASSATNLIGPNGI